ncbi:hypothetical protein ASE69_03555 [Sphingomonas sp. Leaf208]|uniref:hypothetical protein n=1 Tax=Sphingomonas sp. Leaf208 TaxID=1735679 RepID=UPI0006FC06D2|nr:hypothetical protein [Sphingomonas sp. Leaf208]KQM56702.1 hypothetical protein ASE69_03555 [Sphingomonas sp. Leaf208]
MRVVLDNGTLFDLGETEATPSIGITDFSRRVTDDFGVTTVVERGFSRRLSVKLALPFDGVSALQQRLADLRATSALWVASDRLDWLSVRGFYKDFDLDHAVPPVSYCTLTVEGLAETTTAPDDGSDPAPIGATSTLRLIQPVTIDGAALANSSVTEDDYPEWAASATYATGTRVVKAATHRVYESAANANVGNDPAGVSGKWLDVGPTNRWAMFDQALGSVTSAADTITVALDVTGADAVALLDVTGAAVRVQADGYDRTTDVAAGAITFLDLPLVTGRVTVTIAGTVQVSVGTLLIGRLRSLGITEASPTAGITDFSRKVVDDFGDVTVVQRAWSKRMAAKALIRTDAVDVVANRLAAVRARPSLWIGRAGLDSLTVYGFFKDFSIEVGVNVSKLSLTIEGLSKAAPVVPFSSGGSVAWPDVTDPTGTKPTDNADVTSDNTSKDTNAVGGKPATDLLKSLDELEKVTIPAVNAAVAQADARITAAAGEAAAAVAEANAQIVAANGRVTAAQATLDQAVTDLNAEISRAQGKDEQLSQRIDALIVEGNGYDDTNVRALIEQAETVRADGDRALAERIDRVVTSYQDLDTATNARITDTAQALASADEAIARRATEIESRASTSGGNLVPNSSLSTLDGWLLTYNSGLASEVGLNGAGVPFMIGGVENNLVLHRTAAGAGLCSEAQSSPFAVRPGSSLQFYVFTASHRCRAWVSVFFLNSENATIGYGGENPGARINAGGQDLNQWDQTGLKETVVPDGAVRATIVLRSYDVEVDGYAWFSRPFVTEVRPGTTTWAPYSAGNDRGILSATRALVSSVATTLADADQAIGRRMDSVTADYQGRDSATNTRITDTATALANADEAIGQRISEVQSGFTSGGGNLLSNTDFVTSDGWSESFNVSPRPSYLINAAGAPYHPVGESVLSIVQGEPTGGDAYYADWVSPVVAVVPGSFIQFSAMCASHRADTQIFLGWIGTDGVIFAFAPGNLNSSTEKLANDPTLYKRSGLVAVQAPANAVAALMLMRKGDTYDGQGNSYAWFWRPYIGGARQGQNGWNDWSPGSGRAVQIATDARVSTSITTLANADQALGQRIDSVTADYQGRDANTNARVDQVATSSANANQAVADLSTTVSTRFDGVNLTLSGYDQRITSLSNDQQGYVGRTSSLEAQMSRQAPSALNSFTDDVNNRLTQVDTNVNARIKSSEDVIADLPNRYAAASRTATLEAQLNERAPSTLRGDLDTVNGRIDTVNGSTVTSLSARIEDRATAIADAKAGAVASTLSQLRAEYNGTVASVTQQAGAIVNLQGKASAYVRIVADAGNGRAALSLWSDQYGGAWTLTGNGQIDGDLTVNGTITARKFDRTSMSREGTATWSGYITPSAGQVITVPWSLSLTQIPPVGRFIYEYSFALTTNEGQAAYGGTDPRGRPITIYYVSDGGGLAVFCADGQGNAYTPRPNSSDPVLASTDFVPTFTASVRMGTRNETIDDGDNVQRYVAATYTLTGINLKVTWVAI